MPEGAGSSSAVNTPEQIPKTSRGIDTANDAALKSFPAQLRGPQRYEILGEHGRGGLGRVSRAYDRKLGRDVAIKELHSSGAGNEVRFLREVLITARLEHPGIVPVHEAGRWPDGTPYYAMKLVSGRPLRDLIAERTTFEQRIGLLHHVIAVADAIAYAHGRNIIHRDLKPANVIVGDFGETVVIDWGLAKDLGASETSVEVSLEDSGSLPPSLDGELTVEGSVLGTPAYMAPEQKRGESVDQRADVFAIGAMLWEMCALPKVPQKAHLRQRMLRGAGIDKDLATIVTKALAPERDDRYADAGALAADLKAFKSGARIAARDYSLLAMLAHWTRRHRTLALVATAAVAIAIGGSLLFVRNIAIERDRADRSLDELTLKHAELLLTTDPSAALDALLDYRGADMGRADQIRAEAIGRGVAFLRALPHTGTIRWTTADSDGAVITLSTDGTIARTYFDGTSVVLARGVSRLGRWSYSRARHLLTYTCDPSDLCLLDLARTTRTPLASVLQGASVSGFSLSPNGTSLAVISKDGILRLVDLTEPARAAIRFVKEIDATTGDVAFVDDSIVVVVTRGGLEFVRVNGDRDHHVLSDILFVHTSASDRRVAVVTKTGEALVVEAFPARITARASLCHGSIAALEFIPGGRGIAYACKEGAVGIWDPQGGTVRPRAQLDGHADFVTASSTGDYLVAVGGNSTIAIIDLATDLIASYKGHGFRLTSITPPSPDHPFVISADVRGALRVWPLPPRVARVAATASAPFHWAFFNKESTTVTATTLSPALTVYSPSSGVRSVEPHELLNIFLQRSGNGAIFVSYGFEDLVEVWSYAPMARTRVITTGHGSVSQLQFVSDSEDFITSGSDGRLVRWTPAGDRTVLVQFNQSIDRFATISGSRVIVLSTVDGALWRTEAGAPIDSLRPAGSRVSQILEAPRQQRVYVGYASGDVIAIHTKSWQQQTVLRGVGAVREIAITDDAKTIAVATNDGTIHIATLRDDASDLSVTNWVTLLARARDIALTPDGLLVATCTDGTIWLYSTSRRRSLCLPTGAADLGKTEVAANGKTAVVLDREGRLLWIDLDHARKLLHMTSPTPERR